MKSEFEMKMKSEIDSDRKQHGLSRRFLIAWAVALFCVFSASTGLVMARQTIIRRQISHFERTVALGPHVLATQLSSGRPSRTIKIPASVHGYIETPVYAKVAGYMKTINVDKGDRVKAGQTIVLIESPETDKQVSDARSYYWLQAVTDRRYQDLVRQQVVPQQTADTSHATMLQAKAAYEQELAMQHYEVAQSPYDGIVTARYVDPGTLIPQATTPPRNATDCPSHGKWYHRT
jgi:membrane fusion protein, multidrug efflux system